MLKESANLHYAVAEGAKWVSFLN